MLLNVLGKSDCLLKFEGKKCLKDSTIFLILTTGNKRLKMRLS